MTDVETIKARADAATPWDEEWRAIPGADGYEVSDFGHVRSYYLRGNHKAKRSPYPRTLALRASSKQKGYLSVSLPCNDRGGYATRAVHRLVMLAFVGECPPGHEVAHLNGDPTDNRLINLRYVTHVENESHKREHGTDGRGERNAASKLMGWQVAEIKFLASKNVPQGKIAALFDLDQKRISEVLSERIWAGEPARTDIPWLLDRLAAVKAERDEALRELAVPCTALIELQRLREAVHAVERELAWLPSRYTVADENAARVVGLLNTDAYKLAERLRAALSAGQPDSEET